MQNFHVAVGENQQGLQLVFAALPRFLPNTLFATLLFPSFFVQDFHVAVGEDQQGLQLVFEMLHLFLEQPRWDDSAMERAKQAFLSGGR